MDERMDGCMDERREGGGIESEVTTFLPNFGMILEPAIREHMGKV